MADYRPADEQHMVHREDEDSAGMIAVLLIAAALIIGLLLYAMRAFPFGNTETGSESDVDLPNVTTPNMNIDANTPPQ